MADELQLSRDLILRKYAEWHATASHAYNTMGIRLYLSNDVWEALAHHAHLECRMLCEDVIRLPRELRDIIYDGLLTDMALALTPSESSPSETSWQDSLPHLKTSPSGQVFLHEFMGLFYSRTSFQLVYKVPGRAAPGDTTVRAGFVSGSMRGTRLVMADMHPSIPPFSTPLANLLLKCPFGSTHIPVTLIDKLEITIPRNHHEWEDPSPADLLEIPDDAAPVVDSRVKITIRAPQYKNRLRAAKSCYRGPWTGESAVYAKEVLRRLEPALTRWAELGVDVQLQDVRFMMDIRTLYPSSALLTEVREEAANMRVECRESNRSGLRKLGGVRKRYA